MSLNLKDFAPLVEMEEVNKDDEVSFLETQEEVPSKLTRGQKAAMTRKINKMRKAGELVAYAAMVRSDPSFDGMTEQQAQMVIDAAGKERDGMAAFEATDYTEADPSGKAAHTPGAKLDAGKIDMAMILASFPRALFGVGSIGMFGAEKYSYEGFLEVEEGVHRYTSAGIRHFLQQFIEGPMDNDSKYHHLAHEAWNALAKLELYCRERDLDGQFKVIL